MLAGKAAPLSLQSSEQARQKDMIPGFVKAKEVVTPKVYPPPKIPPSYRPVHQPAPQLPSGVFRYLHLRTASPVSLQFG